jgi:hypothetical protein
MKSAKRTMLVLFLLVYGSGSILFSQTSTTLSMLSGFYGGAEFVSCTDLFVLSPFGDSNKVPGTFNGYAIQVGYMAFSREDGVGGGVSLMMITFGSFDFLGEHYVTDPPRFSNVAHQFFLMDPHLIFTVYKQLFGSIYFLFGMSSSSYDYLDTKFAGEAPSPSPVSSGNAYPGRKSKAEFQGGGGLGIRIGLFQNIQLVCDYRLMVGRTSSSGYDLYVNGVNTGSAGGETDYAKMVSAGLRYVF